MAEEKPLDQVPSEDFFRDALTPEPAEPAEPVAVEPAVAEPPPAPEPPAPAAEPGIPSWRLREEAEGRRQAEDRARMLEARLNEIAAHMQQTQKPPDFFDNPDVATQALIQRTLQPFAEEMRQQRELARKTEIYNSRLVASAFHGREKVDEAEQTFLKAMNDQSLDPADYEKVVQAPNRYDAVVEWHKRHRTLSSVGDDPEAWYRKRLEADLADPKFQSEVLGKIQGSAASRPPMTRLPPSLSKSTASRGSSDVEGDMSDQSLFAFATKR